MWHVSTGILAALSVRFLQCRFISGFFFFFLFVLFSQVCAYYCYDLFSGCNFGFVTWNTLETLRAFSISYKPSNLEENSSVKHAFDSQRNWYRALVERFPPIFVIWALLSSLKLPLVLGSFRTDQRLLLKCQDLQCWYPSTESWVRNDESRKLVLTT